TVVAHKHARRSDPDDVKIEVVPFEGGVTICAVYPTPRRAREENDCAPGDSWHSNTEDNDVQADFTVTVPKGVEFDGQTVNGDIDSDFPMTVSGKFGPRRVRATIGSGGRTLELKTVNGSIRLRKNA